MKKGQILEGIVTRVDFPGKAIVETEEGIVTCKGCIPGQKVQVMVTKARSQGVELSKRKAEGLLKEVVQKSPIEVDSLCPHFNECGGCSYQTLPYDEQLKMKERQVFSLLKPFLVPEGCAEDSEEVSKVWLGIKGSPIHEGYRNKMEFSFGDEYKDGPLSLGMHKRGSFYDVVTTSGCRIVDEDYRKILACVLDYCTEQKLTYFHKQRHTGYLRHLLVRKAKKTGEILIAIVTSSEIEGESVLEPLKERLLKLDMKLTGSICGIVHTYNDSVADTVQADKTVLLYGQDFFYESVLGLIFKVTQFSFFQTNTLGCEVLYSTARDFLKEIDGGKVIFDLYSGTGTIAQLMSPVADRVIGVEIVEEAVDAARMNAELNGIDNCTFIAGDVLKVLDTIEEHPDYIILDPPRDGIHPKALTKIIDYGVERLLYISCKPTSLARDLQTFYERGYRIEKACCIDQFPGTVHVETVCLLSRKDN